ncbi:hypothetical protein [Aquimarina latercula]|uniref:hypothetical protein n=1 Tax=Aquimarina latercula TaxID=987 RepID=UPI0003FE21D6|nr:hypothetical protein [Aquimarina latercula]
MDEFEKKYPYQGKWFLIILGIILFGGAAVLFFIKAIDNEKGLIINKLIKLSETEAAIFHWIFFTISLLFVIAASTGAYLKLKKKEFLVLKTDSIIIPPVGFKRVRTEIKFSNVISIDEMEVNRNLFLTIVFEGGKRTVTSNLLEKKSDYQYIKTYISNKINTTQQDV